MNYDIRYMQHALRLAAQGRGEVSPNPMVGAVIVHDNRIIGQGYHRQWGRGHAEVNAIASVHDPSLLPLSTMYVTLEPCSHYGKTPPCAALLIDKGIKKVVVGAVDPFSEVSGRGIKMLRDNGVDVVTGILADQSEQLNARFFTAHRLKRPFITLKWACSADGYMDRKRVSGEHAARFSTPITSMSVHRLRSLHDAVLTSAATVNADNPILTTRLWPGRDARPVVIQRNTPMAGSSRLCERTPLIVDGHRSIEEIFRELYSMGITSVMVEAGAGILNSIIETGLWDAARIEISPQCLRDEGKVTAPAIPTGISMTSEVLDGNTLISVSNNDLYIPGRSIG